ncbi:hypothetical protein BC834DRAFT_861094 [Gloeopeniophorella convolvens]|nr:hypothetical protein BC834DRAFT_861094 [Gloeopeniophorella convolvens]
MLRYALTGHHHPPVHPLWFLHDPVCAAPIRARLLSLSRTVSESENTPRHDVPEEQLPHASRDSTTAEKASDTHPRLTSALRTPAQPTSPPPVRHARARTLRPLLLPPSFSSPLLPPMPIFEPPTPPLPTPRSTVLALAGLPPGTTKADVRPVLQRFGALTRIRLRASGTRADAVFADPDAVTRALHAYAEGPLVVRGQPVVLFRGDAGNDEEVDVKTVEEEASERWDDGRDALFVSSFPRDTLREDVRDALERLGHFDEFIMRPGSQYAHFLYSSPERVDEILAVHARSPVSLHGQRLRIERSTNRPYSPRLPSAEAVTELEPPMSAAEARDTIDELRRTVPGWRGAYAPSRVLWIGRLPRAMPADALAAFWARLGTVVDVRTSYDGFAHIEFACIADALHAARQGAPHGFAHSGRLLAVDFAPWVFHIGVSYRSAHIVRWPADRNRDALLRWASKHNAPKPHMAYVLPAARGAQDGMRSALLWYRRVDDARLAVRTLAGTGAGVVLSRATLVPPNRLWLWAAEDEDGEEPEEWGGLGFGANRSVERHARRARRYTPVEELGTRGGRVSPVARRHDGRVRDAAAVLTGQEGEEREETGVPWPEREVTRAATPPRKRSGLLQSIA